MSHERCGFGACRWREGGISSLLSGQVSAGSGGLRPGGGIGKTFNTLSIGIPRVSFESQLQNEQTQLYGAGRYAPSALANIGLGRGPRL